MSEPSEPSSPKCVTHFQGCACQTRKMDILEVALAELALAKERLGPAGWKILQEYEVYRRALEEIVSIKKHSSSCGDLNNPFNGKMVDGCNCGTNELTEIRIAREALREKGRCRHGVHGDVHLPQGDVYKPHARYKFTEDSLKCPGGKCSGKKKS